VLGAAELVYTLSRAAYTTNARVIVFVACWQTASANETQNALMVRSVILFWTEYRKETIGEFLPVLPLFVMTKRNKY
jgi:hypothetical protein